MLKQVADGEEMVVFGEELGAKLFPGDLLLLKGPLGVGKTTLVKGILKKLIGVDPISVQSPTYSYIHPYSSHHSPVFHFDLYRLEDEKTFYDLDLDAYLTLDGICLVEWPERVPTLSHKGRTIALNLSYCEKGRVVEVEGL